MGQLTRRIHLICKALLNEKRIIVCICGYCTPENMCASINILGNEHQWLAVQCFWCFLSTFFRMTLSRTLFNVDCRAAILPLQSASLSVVWSRVTQASGSSSIRLSASSVKLSMEADCETLLYLLWKQGQLELAKKAFIVGDLLPSYSSDSAIRSWRYSDKLIRLIIHVITRSYLLVSGKFFKTSVDCHMLSGSSALKRW